MLNDFFQKYNKVSLLVAFIAVNNIIALTFSLGYPYYLIMFGAFLYCIKKEALNRINLLGIFFFCFCALTIIINNVPDLFNPWMRLSTFIMVTLLIGPFVKSGYLEDVRIEVYNIIQLMLQPIVLLSFITYFLHISFSRFWVGFAGITSHSMILAPICGVVFSWSLYQLFKPSCVDKYLRLYWIVLACICMLCVLLTASRMALIATIAELVVFILYKLRDNLSAFLKWTIIVVSVLSLTTSYWMPFTEALQVKNAGSIRDGGITSSRDSHWIQRISEFESSPVVGIGFGAISTDSKLGSNFDETSGKVETGSSWLSVLSMTGVVGFMIFVSFFIRAIRQLKIIALDDGLLSLVLLVQLIFWMVHMIAEGYILSAGGFLFFNVWLLLGTIDAYKERVFSNE